MVQEITQEQEATTNGRRRRNVFEDSNTNERTDQLRKRERDETCSNFKHNKVLRRKRERERREGGGLKHVARKERFNSRDIISIGVLLSCWLLQPLVLSVHACIHCIALQYNMAQTNSADTLTLEHIGQQVLTTYNRDMCGNDFQQVSTITCTIHSRHGIYDLTMRHE